MEAPQQYDITLSVLIPTLTERKHSCNRLLHHLNIIKKNYPIEILIEEDEGELTTGVKRNMLIDRAKGKFSCFIDDDDDVPDWYFDSIFRLLHNEPDTDCIGFKGLIIYKDRRGQNKAEVFKHAYGLPYSPGIVHGEYLRPPNHLNPMFTEYFRAIRFPDLTFAEDYDFCLKLAATDLIKHPKFLNIVMYHYKYTPKPKKDESPTKTDITSPAPAPDAIRADAEAGNTSTE